MTLVLLLVLGGCQGAEDPPPQDLVLYDLVEQFASTEQQEVSASSPQAVAESRSLFLPAGQQIDFYLKLPRSSTLTIDRVSARRQPAPEHLALSFQRAGEAEAKTIASLEPGDRRHVISIPDGSQPISRLTLRADAAPNHDGGALLISQPRILTPAGESPERPAPTPPEPADSAAAPDLPNIVLYLVDTLRADHLGVYGYDRPTSPSLDAFAAHAVLFDHAIAHSSWTKPSVASIFTGLEPHLHSAHHTEDALPTSALTIAEMLSASGYQTAAFVSNRFVGSDFEFQQGFDIFHPPMPVQTMTAEVSKLLRSGELSSPFFLYVHTSDPHSPYTRHEPFASTFAKGIPSEFGLLEYLVDHRTEIDAEDLEKVTSLYDAGVAFADEYFGRFLAVLREVDLHDPSVVVFVADHGEELWDNGTWGHGDSLYSEVLRVPLIIKPPFWQENRRVSELVGLVDIFPTLMDFSRVETPPYLSGRSLYDHLLGGIPPDDHIAYSELDRQGYQGLSVMTNEWKLIVPMSEKFGNEAQLFKWRSDVGENRNQIDQYPIVAGYLRSLLRSHKRRSSGALEASQSEMSEELVQELKALGYLQ